MSGSWRAHEARVSTLIFFHIREGTQALRRKSLPVSFGQVSPFCATESVVPDGCNDDFS
jgi:hypothetical protein